MRGPLSIGSLALVTALALPVQARAHDPFSFSAGQLDVLTWTEMCSNTEIVNVDLRFSTCASAELTLFDNGWLKLEVWNRSGLDDTWENTAIKGVGIGGVPSPYGQRGLGANKEWEALFDGDQADWEKTNNITGANTAGGFGTNGNKEALCSGLATDCPGNGGLVTEWNGFGNGGGATFIWFIDDALSMLDPTKISLQLHVGSGPGGESTGYACFSDGYEHTLLDKNGNPTAKANKVKWGDCESFDTPDEPGVPQETVPEPATMTLLATGLAGMAAARRRRNRN